MTKGPRFVIEPDDTYEETHWVMMYFSEQGLKARVFFSRGESVRDGRNFRIYPQGSPRYAKVMFMLYHYYSDGQWPYISRCGRTTDLTYQSD